MKSTGNGSWLIENLNPSTVLNTENVSLAKILKDVFGTSMVPDIDNEKIKLSLHCSRIRGFTHAVPFSLFLVRSFLAYKVTFKIMIFLCKSCIELATKIYNLATKFFPLVASWLQSKKNNFEPCMSLTIKLAPFSQINQNQPQFQPAPETLQLTPYLHTLWILIMPLSNLLRLIKLFTVI